MSKEKEYFSYIKKLVKEINSIERTSVTIKLHPSEKYLDKYKKVIRQSNFKNISVVQKIGSKYLYKLINESDLVIEFASTAAIESIILDKPTITTDYYTGSSNYTIIKESGGTYKINYKDNIAPLIKEIFSNDYLKEKRRQAVEKICGNIDGKSSERITKMIIKSIEKWKHIYQHQKRFIE